MVSPTAVPSGVIWQNQTKIYMYHCKQAIIANKLLPFLQAKFSYIIVSLYREAPGEHAYVCICGICSCNLFNHIQPHCIISECAGVMTFLRVVNVSFHNTIMYWFDVQKHTLNDTQLRYGHCTGLLFVHEILDTHSDVHRYIDIVKLSK